MGHQSRNREIAASLLLSFSAGTLYAWSAVAPGYMDVFGLGVGDAGMAFSFAICAFTLAVFFGPRIRSNRNPVGNAAAASCVGMAFVTAAMFAPSEWLFLLCYALGAGGICGLIYIDTLTVAAASRSPARVTPLVVAAFGLGGVLFGPVLRQLGALGLGLFVLVPVAVSFGIAGLAGFAAVRGRWSAGIEQAIAPQAQPVNRFLLVMLMVCFGTCAGAGLLVLGLSSSIVEKSGGSLALSTGAIAGVALTNMIGRLSVSVLCAVLRPTGIVVLASAVAVAGAAILNLAGTPEMLTVGLVLVGLGYGMIASGIPVLCTAAFGTQGFSRAFPQVFLSWGLAGLTAPWLAGWLFGQTGDFAATCRLTLALTVAALATAVLMKPVMGRIGLRAD